MANILFNIGLILIWAGLVSMVWLQGKMNRLQNDIIKQQTKVNDAAFDVVENHEKRIKAIEQHLREKGEVI
jgi:hypothetical protein